MMPQKTHTSGDNMVIENNGNVNKRSIDEDSPIKLDLEEMEDCHDNSNDPLEGENDDIFIEKVSHKIEGENMEHDDDKVIAIDVSYSLEDQINKDVIKSENDKNSEKSIVKNKDPQIVNHVWVSNVGQVKASELKKHFSQLGKVVTAKIMSNGKSFYGYVCMESAKLAEDSMSQLNNSLLNGRKILVTRKRPDYKENQPKVQTAPGVRSEKKIRKEKPNVIKSTESNSVPAETVVDEKAAVTIENLTRKLRDSTSDAARYKTKFRDCQRQNDFLLRKIENLERQVANTQSGLRNERRKLNKEREEFEKKQKLDEIRMEADRVVLNKELSEVRKLRAHLKEKTEEYKSCSTNIAKRARSPVLRSVRSPLHFRTSEQSSKFRSEERPEKRSKREEAGRNVAPPPPPKLNEPPKKRSSDVYAESRNYFSQNDKKYVPPQSYEYRHKPSFAPNPEMSRNNFQMMFPKETRRANVFPSPGESYHLPRGGYQHQSNNVPLTPRNFHGQYYNSY